MSKVQTASTLTQSHTPASQSLNRANHELELKLKPIVPESTGSNGKCSDLHCSNAGSKIDSMDRFVLVLKL
eukprot:1434238-Rhodomonas_salina.3